MHFDARQFTLFRCFEGAKCFYTAFSPEAFFVSFRVIRGLLS